MGLILIKHSRHIARLCSQNWSGNSIVLCIAILSYSTISPSRDNWWWSWSHYLLFDFIFRPHCKARSTLWHFKRQDWHFDYHLPMQSYRCLWLSYPISRQKRLKKSPRLTYNYNHIIASHKWTQTSNSHWCMLFSPIIVTVHQPVRVTSGQPSRMTSFKLSVSKLSVLPLRASILILF